MFNAYNGRAMIVAFRGERGSYNTSPALIVVTTIVAFRGERGSYNVFE